MTCREGYMQNLNDSIKDYEKALSQLGGNAMEILNIDKHHNMIEASLDDLLEKLEKNVTEELVEEKNKDYLNSIVEVLKKI